MAKNFLFSIIIFLISSPFVSGQYNPLTNHQNSNLAFSSETKFTYSDRFQPKSEQKAMLLTAAVPATTILTGLLLLRNDVPLGGWLVVGGFVVGPSAGNIYAENTGAVLKAIGTRLIGGGMQVIGSYYMTGELFAISPIENGSDGLSVAGAIIFLSGTGLVIYSFINDLFQSAENVRKYNQKYQTKGLAVSPTYFLNEKSPGISFSLSF